MAKGNLQDAINYAKQNPNSDFARQLKIRIKSGQADQEATDLGIDLSWAGRPFVKPKIQEQKPIIEKEKRGLFEGLEEFSTGFVKGGLETAIETAELLQKGGQAVLAGVTPGETYKEIKEKTGFESLKGEKAEEIDELLKAKTGYEKAGKIAEFVTEIFWPVGKTTEVAGAARKGKDIIETVIEKTKTIPDDLTEGGIKVKDRLMEVFTTLDDKTKTALERTSKEEFNKMVEIGRKAVKDDRILTPIEEVGKDFVQAAQSIKNKLTKIGSQKRTVLEKAKTAYKNVSDLVSDAILQIQKGKQGLGPEDQKYADEIIARFKPYLKQGKLKDVDALIDDLQDGLYKLSGSEKAVQLTDKVTGLIRSSVEGLNKKLQTRAGGSYAKLNKQYSDLLKILNDVNRNVGKKGERAGSFMKQFFSPSGTTAKRLFADMQKLTNIDFAKNARLAKFVMETLGDKRVESLLEQIPKTKAQVAGKIWDYAMKKTGLNDPIKAAEKFIEQQMK